VRLEQTIGRSITLSDSTPEALVEGYGLALAEILAELSAALRSS
jgi:hypothetical protein